MPEGRFSLVGTRRIARTGFLSVERSYFQTPAGGWMRSERGVSRFGWRELRDVYSDADQVLLLFSDRLGVIVPARAFEPQTEQDELVAEIEAWRAATGWRRSKGPAPERRAPEGVPDPFAPPE